MQGERPRWAEIAYDAIAPAYDDFTSNHDYDLWLGNLLPALERHGLPSRGRLLDVGCGTGKSFLPMIERGWQVTGCDISSAMVDRARTKVPADAQLFVADMRELPEFGSFDLVWALDDAVNYLLSAEELTAALAGMRANLTAGGLILFDMNTLLAYRGFFSQAVTVDSEDWRMTWRGRAPTDMDPGAIAEASFEATPLGATHAPVAEEIHRERHFPPEIVLDSIDRAGLRCLEVFGHHEDAVLKQPLDETAHTKAIYIAAHA